ncbi:MAG: hypothetical protein CM1200mP10_06020 [Candidatus Neomarinimicrobiota bacterium]|nr:MAG: hypothetical protein CM1200mP10_06020 [Candidatus Neomarinimicrobiota bacterium]
MFCCSAFFFVEEQNIFFETDQDEFDKNAIHIAAFDTNTGKVSVLCDAMSKRVAFGMVLDLQLQKNLGPTPALLV